MHGPKRRKRGLWLCLLIPLAGVALMVVAMLGFALALGGSLNERCSGPSGPVGRGDSPGVAPSRTARQEIPPTRLALYRRAGRAENIDWTFLASVGAQECNHGLCRGDNGVGCAGPMQIAMRRGSPCSPGSGPTLWELYRVDGDRNGTLDVNHPADAIPTAARVLRREKGAPPVGGTYAEYRTAACRYYGACSDKSANYADEVMHRAVSYGFRGDGTPDTAKHPDPTPTEPPADAVPGGSGCGGSSPSNLDADEARRIGGGARRATEPRELAPLPSTVVAPGFGALRCDARIVPDVVFLMRRFGVRVTACQSIHSLSGEHPLGAAIDVVPGPTGGWDAVQRLARALGWKRSCAASGVAPECARPPFRFIGHNGYPGHGDPQNCIPCGGGPHLHLSWQTSASQGQPESRPRSGHFAPSWIAVMRNRNQPKESNDRTPDH